MVEENPTTVHHLFMDGLGVTRPIDVVSYYFSGELSNLEEIKWTDCKN